MKKNKLFALLVTLSLFSSSCALLIFTVGTAMQATSKIKKLQNNMMFNTLPYQLTDEQYADKYLEQMEEGSEVLKTWYHYTVEELDGDFIVKTYHPDTKQITEYYTYDTQLLTFKNGKCAEWWDNGNKKLEGLYEGSMRVGEWSFFDAKTGTKAATGFYRKDIKEGLWKYFDPATGNILLQTNYSNNVKNGPFLVFNENGETVGKGRFFSGKVDTVHWEVENSAAFDYLLAYEYSETKGNGTVDKMPYFTVCEKNKAEVKEDWCTEEMLFDMLDTLEYPEDALRHRVEGQAIISFTVTKTGAIKDISIDRGLCEEYKNAITEAMKSMPEWSPARKDGKAVEYRYTFIRSFNRADVYEEADGTKM